MCPSTSIVLTCVHINYMYVYVIAKVEVVRRYIHYTLYNSVYEVCTTGADSRLNKKSKYSRFIKSYKRELFDAHLLQWMLKEGIVSAPHTFFSAKIRSIVLGEIFALKNDYLGILADQNFILFTNFTRLYCNICSYFYCTLCIYLLCIICRTILYSCLKPHSS